MQINQLNILFYTINNYLNNYLFLNIYLHNLTQYLYHAT